MQKYRQMVAEATQVSGAVEGSERLRTRKVFIFFE